MTNHHREQRLSEVTVRGVTALDRSRDPNDLRPIIRQCRTTVCEAYFSGGHHAALAAIAAASIRLSRYVYSGSLIPAAAYGMLQEVAENLTLVRVLGQDLVDTAINAGSRFYEELAGVA